MPKYRIRRDPRFWTAAIVAASLVATGCSSRKAEAERTTQPTVVSVFETRRMNVPIVADTNGTTRALDEVSIRARVRGFLKERHFTEGSDVKAGTLLFVIEEDKYQAQVDSAKAKLAAAEASLAKAKQSKAREIATAKLMLDQALSTLAQIEERRQKALDQRRATSREDLDRAVADRQKNEAQVESDRANLDQSNADYDVNILAADAEVAAARAELRSAEIDLGYCRVFAPIDGRIGEAKVKLGNVVGPAATGGSGYTELATIQRLDPMGIDIQVSSRYLTNTAMLIGKGLEVRLIRPGIDGDAEYPQPGQAYFIDNTIEPTTSTFLVKAQVPNPLKSLLPGEYVKVNVTVDNLADAIVVPERAVMRVQGGDVVYTVDAAGKVELTNVKSGPDYRGLRVIQSGLESGRKVIVDGLPLVRPGSIVRDEPAIDTIDQPPAIPQSTPTPPPSAKPDSSTKPDSSAKPAPSSKPAPSTKPDSSAKPADSAAGSAAGVEPKADRPK